MKTTILPLVALFATLASPVPAQNPEDDERFKKFLKRFPESDLDKDGVLTREEVTTFNRKRRAAQGGDAKNEQNRPMPTHADVKYGNHEKQAFDIWLAESKDGKPTPLAIYIHGGGFRGGDKKGVSPGIVKRFHDAGISFASMNYRLTENGKYPYPVAMHDSARGLQMIRSKAKEWNIDSDRIACYGGSAGAGISLWLGFHEDLAKPDSKDPVEQQSTRIVAAGTSGGQSTYDMHTFREWFEVPDLPPHDALKTFFNLSEEDGLDSERVKRDMRDASAITHLTKDDVPVYMVYSRPNTKVTKQTSQGEWVHHALLGIKLKEAMEKLGLECNVNYPGNKEGDYADMTAFLIAKLKGDGKKPD